MRQVSILLFFTLYAWGQRYVTDTLIISFYSDAPLEKIAAENRTGCTSWVDFATDSVYVRVKVRNFSFPNKLMEEHFNESYLETDRYPYAFFRGKLVAPFPYTQEGTYAVSARGIMEIHGVQREEIVSGLYEVRKDQQLVLTGRFFVRPADYKIKVPRMLWEKIATEVEVSFRGIYRRQ
ncbi:MAG: YceI family protein [Bacteroidia bacterium]|nr:YceI family protein [Bacteroidia bacterium]MDW8014705.1 YceI family protein [Bacteroidia bacterium]